MQTKRDKRKRGASLLACHYESPHKAAPFASTFTFTSTSPTYQHVNCERHHDEADEKIGEGQRHDEVISH